MVASTDKLIIENLSDGLWGIKSGANQYAVSFLDDQWHCTCPSRYICKHIKAVQEQQDSTPVQGVLVQVGGARPVVHHQQSIHTLCYQFEQEWRAANDFHLAEDQMEALVNILKWMQTDEPAFLLEGRAGTGKSTVIQAVVFLLQIYREMSGTRIPVCLSAFTHQAVKVLRRMAGRWGLGGKCEFATVCSLLGITPTIDNATGLQHFKQAKEEKAKLPNYRLVIIDEAFQLNAEAFSIITRSAKTHGVKVLYVGDGGQVNPIGEPYSPVSKLKQRFELTIPKRNHAVIANLANSIRDVIEGGPMPTIVDAQGGGETIWVQPEPTMMKWIKGKITQNPEENVALAYTNAKVNETNQEIRFALHGLEAPEILVGDTLISRGPVVLEDTTVVLSTSELCEVRRARLTTAHEPSLNDSFVVWELDILTIDRDFPETYTVQMMSNAHKERYSKALDALKKRILANKEGMLWREYYRLRDERFADLSDPWALTIHKAQGSTYKNVFLWIPNPRSFWDRDTEKKQQREVERRRLIYTGITRASSNLVVCSTY